MHSGERKHFSLIKTNVHWVRVIMFREVWCGELGTARELRGRVSQQFKHGLM